MLAPLRGAEKMLKMEGKVHLDKKVDGMMLSTCQNVLPSTCRLGGVSSVFVLTQRQTRL